jgi:hypothetical protein
MINFDLLQDIDLLIMTHKLCHIYTLDYIEMFLKKIKDAKRDYQQTHNIKTSLPDYHKMSKKD